MDSPAQLLRALIDRTTDMRVAILGRLAGYPKRAAPRAELCAYILRPGADARRFNKYITDLISDGCIAIDLFGTVTLMPVSDWKGAQAHRCLPFFAQEMMRDSDDVVRERAEQEQDSRGQAVRAPAVALAPATARATAPVPAVQLASEALALARRKFPELEAKALAEEPEEPARRRRSQSLAGLRSAEEIRNECERAIGPALRHPNYGRQWMEWMDHDLDLVEYALEELRNKQSRQGVRNPAAFMSSVIRLARADPRPGPAGK